jgi:CheY-like chemotaxis protein
MKTIMVVDDEADNRTTLKNILEKNGYTVLTAESGDDCLKKLAKQKVDLIMLDIMMPGMPTNQLVSKIKKTLIVYVTAVQMSESERRELLKQNGAVDFVQKPYDIKTVLQSVKSALNK